MGVLKRREFLSTILKNETKKSTPIYDINKDVVFKKYANKTSPLSLNKKRAGLTQYSGVWTEKQHIHLLRRLTFGVKKSDLATLSSMTMNQAVDYMINTAITTPAPPVNFYENLYADPTGIALGNTWINAAYGDGTVNYYRELSIQSWWIKNIVTQPMTIHEKMILFWHNCFVTESQVVGDARFQFKYLQLLRANSIGNFKTFVKDITLDPQMLIYLNGHFNVKNSPDENYGRELQELFTIGKGTSMYTEDDVKMAAQVLTGYRVDTSTISSAFDPTKHETGNKQFSAFYNNAIITGQSGANGANELDDLLNMIFSKTDLVAKYFCRKLYRFFVYYDIDTNIESTIIAGLAQTLITNNWDVKPVLLQLFKSDHFYDSNSMDCLLKTPMDIYAGMFRTLNLTIPSTLGLEDYYRAYYTIGYKCEEIGMFLGSPPSVAGWPAYYQSPQYHQMWINSDTLPKRMQSTDDLIGTYGWWATPNYQVKCDIIAFAQSLTNPSNPTDLVDECVKLLLGLSLSQTIKDNLKSTLLSGQTNNIYWTSAWNDYIANPTNTTYQGIVESRLRLMLTELLRMAENQLS